MPGEDILNAENNVQTDAADSQPAGDNDGIDLSDLPKADDAPGGAENTETDKKTPEQKYSERLNKDREKMRSELEKEYDPMKARISELEIELRAVKEGKSVDDVMAEAAEEDKARRELLDNDPEVKKLREAVRDTHAKELLKMFQDAYPDDNITSLEGIDQQVYKMIVSGVDPILAYKVVKDANQQKRPPKKDLPESVKSDGPAIDKEFYTSEEIDAFTRDDYKNNPGLMEKVRKSIARLGK
jgi:hypothetical protein